MPCDASFVRNTRTVRSALLARILPIVQTKATSVFDVVGNKADQEGTRCGVGDHCRRLTIHIHCGINDNIVKTANIA